jgi:hypothetical protein
METGLCVISLAIGLPLAVALFEQRSSVETSRLEPEFQNLKDSKGQDIKVLYYNKGM